jgi:hypothetical protein
VPLCVHRPPSIVLLLLNRDHRFIEMPFLSHERTFAPELIGVLLPEFLAPCPNRPLRHRNPAIQQHSLAVPVAQREGVVEPDAVTVGEAPAEGLDFARASVTGVHGQAVVDRGIRTTTLLSD